MSMDAGFPAIYVTFVVLNTLSTLAFIVALPAVVELIHTVAIPDELVYADAALRLPKVVVKLTRVLFWGVELSRTRTYMFTISSTVVRAGSDVISTSTAIADPQSTIRAISISKVFLIEPMITLSKLLYMHSFPYYKLILIPEILFVIIMLIIII